MMKIMTSIPPKEWCGLLRQGHFNKSEIRFDHLQRATHYIARNSHKHVHSLVGAVGKDLSYGAACSGHY